MLVACILAVQKVGWQSIVDTVELVHGSAGTNPLDSAGFGPTYIVWQMFAAGLVSCAVWQTAVMRACSAKDTKVVKRLYVWSSIGFMIRYMIPMFLGVCALAYLWNDEGTRALFFKVGENSQDVVPVKGMPLKAMPVLLSQILPIGLIGLVGAGMLAAFMSTHDSYLLCWSSVLVQDVIGPSLRKPLSTKARLTLARLLILLIGAFLLVWSLWYPLEQDLWEYMAVSGAIYYTGAFALLLAGLYWKRASRVGAYAALLCGALALFGLDPGKRAIASGATAVGVATEAAVNPDTKRIEMTTSEGLQRWGVPGELKLGEEHIVLTTTAMSLLALAIGSLIFPDKKRQPQAES
jgi:SSS family solute:Na+ symporter